MREFPWSMIAVMLVVACGSGSPKAPPVVDSAAMVAARADSLAQARAAEAPVLRDSAKATLAALLTTPASATFDSLLVIQPPEEDGRMPSLVVCGRIGGKPGIGGSRTRTRFIYQNRFTVFVEDATNQRQFIALWARTCGVPGGTVVLEG
ncbi:MAG TPA: hypothetical protein VFN22_10325 [Gemmatimonadales bacterium]|nr:hypothetical protein [Gemmatimonadales bacterium]